MEEYINSLKKNIDKRDLLLALQDFQNKFGYVDQAFIEQLSLKTGIPSGKIYSIASFYNQFRFIRPGKYHIKLCSGAACHVNAKENLVAELYKLIGIKDRESSPDGKYSLEFIPCMGACALGPVMSINNNYYTQLKIKDLKKIIHDLDEI